MRSIRTTVLAAAATLALACSFLTGAPAQSAPQESAPPIATTPNGAPATIPGINTWTAAASGGFRFTPTSSVVAGAGTQGVANQLRTDLADPLKRAVNLKSAASPGDIVMKLDPALAGVGREGYVVSVGETIELTAASEIGLFYGGRTVLQWATLAGATKTIPAGTGSDVPAYPVRGVGMCACMINVSVEAFERLFTEMAYYKMNELWIEYKLESSAYPLANFWSYYTPDQIKHITKVAASKNIKIISEVNSPGHMGPWLYAYPDLQLTDRNGAKAETRLDISQPRSLEMIKQLIDEYLDATGADSWHMGADEYLLGSTGYNAYPQLAAKAKQLWGDSATGQDLFIDFINQVNAYVKGKGKTLRIWNDGIPARYNIKQLDKDIVVEHWTNQGRSAQSLLNDGHDLVNASNQIYFVRGGYGPLSSMSTLWNRNWTPKTFDPFITVNDTASTGKVLGAKLTAWPDNGAGDTENNMEARMHDTVRFVSQATWSTVRPTDTYTAFKALGDALGTGPHWQNVDYRPLPNGTFSIGANNSFLTAGATTTDPATMASEKNAWTFKQTSDGYYTIADSSGRCFDVVGANTKLWLGVPLAFGIKPQVTSCDAGRNLQKWWVAKASQGRYTIRNAITLLPLVVDGVNIAQQNPHKATATQFTIASDGLVMQVSPVTKFVWGQPATVTVDLTNSTAATASGVQVSLSAPDGWAVTGTPTASQDVAVGASAQFSFKVTPSSSAVGTKTLTVKLNWSADGESHTRTATVSAPLSCAEQSTRPTRVVRVSSEQRTSQENSPATNVIDGNPDTFWHTQWDGAEPPHPHELVVKIPGDQQVCAVNLLPRQGSSAGASNGQIRDYELYATNDLAVATGTDLAAWGNPIAQGELTPGKQLSWVGLATPLAAKYVMLRSLSAQNSSHPWTTLAEFSVDAGTPLAPTPEPTAEPTTPPTVDPTSPVQPTAQPSTGVGAQVRLSSTAVRPGSSLVVEASGFTPGEQVRVELHSTPVVLGSATVDAAGNLSLTVTIPTTTTVGSHSIVVIGEASGLEGRASITISMVPPLPKTGGVAASLLVIGLLGAAAGTALLRRKH